MLVLFEILDRYYIHHKKHLEELLRLEQIKNREGIIILLRIHINNYHSPVKVRISILLPQIWSVCKKCESHAK